ncbi:hypothetical protein DFH11DRAFT_1548171 [Phellopilus nigrolimitatus]|nr:hypothetical protein DFH11DRAFT_1548171 [Phellopilus nigrolimitatus]
MCRLGEKHSELNPTSKFSNAAPTLILYKDSARTLLRSTIYAHRRKQPCAASPRARPQTHPPASFRVSTSKLRSLLHSPQSCNESSRYKSRRWARTGAARANPAIDRARTPRHEHLRTRPPEKTSERTRAANCARPEGREGPPAQMNTFFSQFRGSSLREREKKRRREDGSDTYPPAQADRAASPPRPSTPEPTTRSACFRVAALRRRGDCEAILRAMTDVVAHAEPDGAEQSLGDRERNARAVKFSCWGVGNRKQERVLCANLVSPIKSEIQFWNQHWKERICIAVCSVRWRVPRSTFCLKNEMAARRSCAAAAKQRKRTAAAGERRIRATRREAMGLGEQSSQLGPAGQIAADSAEGASEGEEEFGRACETLLGDHGGSQWARRGTFLGEGRRLGRDVQVLVAVRAE